MVGVQEIICQTKERWSERESSVTPTLHIRQNRPQGFQGFAHFFHSLLSWRLSPHPFKAMDLNLLWVMNSSENLMRAVEPLLKKCTDSDTRICRSCPAVSKHPEPHPQSQPNNPNLPLLLPHKVICSFSGFPQHFLFSSKQQ